MFCGWKCWVNNHLVKLIVKFKLRFQNEAALFLIIVEQLFTDVFEAAELFSTSSAPELNVDKLVAANGVTPCLWSSSRSVHQRRQEAEEIFGCLKPGGYRGQLENKGTHLRCHGCLHLTTTESPSNCIYPADSASNYQLKTPLFRVRRQQSCSRGPPATGKASRLLSC